MKAIRSTFLLLLFAMPVCFLACDMGTANKDDGGNGDGYGGALAKDKAAAGQVPIMSTRRELSIQLSGKSVELVETYTMTVEGALYFSRFEPGAEGASPRRVFVNNLLVFQASVAEMNELKAHIQIQSQDAYSEVPGEGASGSGAGELGSAMAKTTCSNEESEADEIMIVDLNFGKFGYSVGVPKNCFDPDDSTYKLYKLIRSFFDRAKVPPLPIEGKGAGF